MLLFSAGTAAAADDAVTASEIIELISGIKEGIPAALPACRAFLLFWNHVCYRQYSLVFNEHRCDWFHPVGANADIESQAVAAIQDFVQTHANNSDLYPVWPGAPLKVRRPGVCFLMPDSAQRSEASADWYRLY
jgi:hypothetical protein